MRGLEKRNWEETLTHRDCFLQKEGNQGRDNTISREGGNKHPPDSSLYPL